MFPEMRRFKQALSPEVTEQILRAGTSGVLALQSADAYPYAVPISYVFEDGKVYFHSAASGYKLELIQAHAQVSFCVIDQDQIVPAERTTYFRSAILFGRARVVEDDAEKQRAMELLAAKYSPGYEADSLREIQKQWRSTCVVAIEIDHFTGKEAIELVRQREK